jgi:hypothetical protein
MRWVKAFVLVAVIGGVVALLVLNLRSQAETRRKLDELAARLPPAREDPTDGPPDDPADVYLLGAGDVLQIESPGIMCGLYVVQQNGLVVVGGAHSGVVPAGFPDSTAPHAPHGGVHVAGLPLYAAQDRLHQHLGRHATLNVHTANSKYVHLHRGVAGGKFETVRYPVSGTVRAADVLNHFKVDGHRAIITVERAPVSHLTPARKPLEVDIAAIRQGDVRTNYALRAGDGLRVHLPR